MFHFATSELAHFLMAYGYWAVLLFVAIESAGIPLPGETMLLIAAIYAGATHRLSLPLVIAAAASGAILGDNLGYWVGREGGYRLLRRYGHHIGIDERKLKLGQYLFRKYGGKVVFFGRFIAVLRTWVAFLAGVNRMPWPSFLLYNALGGIIWATLYGLGGYFLGNNVYRLMGPIGPCTIMLGLLITIVFLLFVRRNEQRLEEVEHSVSDTFDELLLLARDKGHKAQEIVMCEKEGWMSRKGRGDESSMRQGGCRPEAESAVNGARTPTRISNDRCEFHT